MKYQIKIPIKIKTTNDETKLLPGQIIILPEDKAEMLLSEGKIITLRQAFEKRFKSLSQWLLDYPVNFQALRENNKAIYQELMELNRQIDRHWLKEDYPAFIQAVDTYKKEHLKFIKGCLQKRRH